MSQPRPTVLITGANPTGIGGSLALEFLSKNYTVYATSRSPSSLSPLTTQGIIPLQLDISSESSILSLTKSLSEILPEGKLDILIHNAGRNYSMPALDIEAGELEDLFKSNVLGPILLTKSLSKYLIQAKGKIVFIGSIAGVVPMAFGSTYNATKAAIHSYAETLRVELQPFGVRVITIITGGVRSDIARVDRKLPEDSLYLPINQRFQYRVKHSQKSPMETGEYAKQVVQEIIKNNPSWTVWKGYASGWIKWSNRFAPRWVFNWIFGRLYGFWDLKRIIEGKVKKA